MPKTYGTVTTFTAGSVLAAAQLNVASTAVNNLVVPAAAKAVRTSTTTTTGDITFQSVSAPGFDTDSMWAAGAPTRLTINTAGIYLVTFQIEATVSVATSTVQTLAIKKNGTGVASSNFFASITVGNSLDAMTSAVLNLAAGDYLTGNYSPAGGTHTLTGSELTSLAAVWIGRTS